MSDTRRARIPTLATALAGAAAATAARAAYAGAVRAILRRNAAGITSATVPASATAAVA